MITITPRINATGVEIYLYSGAKLYMTFTMFTHQSRVYTCGIDYSFVTYLSEDGEVVIEYLPDFIDFIRVVPIATIKEGFWTSIKEEYEEEYE